MKKKMMAVAMILALIVSAIGCKKTEILKTEIPKTIDTVSIDGKLVTLKPGDKVIVDGINGSDYVFNDKECSKCPVFFNGITVRSTLDDMMEKFDIEPEYAYVSIEVPGFEETDIINQPYKDLDFFEKERVLSVVFIVGYQLEDGKWKKVSDKTIEENYSELEKLKDTIIYEIDVTGDDENYNTNDTTKYEKRCVDFIRVIYGK